MILILGGLGSSDVKGRMLYEQSAPAFMLLQHDFQTGKLSNLEFATALEGLEGRMEECLECLQGEYPGTYGHLMSKRVEQILQHVKEIIQFKEFL